MAKKIVFSICLMVTSSVFFMARSQDISIHAPDKTGGKTLMQALNERQSIRTFTKENLTLNQLSDLFSSWANTGFIAQNVYLYCASANLGCVIRAMVPKDKLTPEMGLRSNQVIILSQTVGIPEK